MRYERDQSLQFQTFIQTKVSLECIFSLYTHALLLSFLIAFKGANHPFRIPRIGQLTLGY